MPANVSMDTTCTYRIHRLWSGSYFTCSPSLGPGVCQTERIKFIQTKIEENETRTKRRNHIFHLSRVVFRFAFSNSPSFFRLPFYLIPFKWKQIEEIVWKNAINKNKLTDNLFWYLHVVRAQRTCFFYVCVCAKCSDVHVRFVSRLRRSSKHQSTSGESRISEISRPMFNLYHRNEQYNIQADGAYRQERESHEDGLLKGEK